ncbi:MAG: glycerate kinase [Blautia sp.]
MKVVVAVDSFKGSLSSLEAGKAIEAGILKCCPDAEVKVRPLADGGEGTVEALIQGMDGKLERIKVTGPHGKPVEARYGIVRGNTAVLEMAEAAGITLLEEEEKNPYYTTTFGVGEIIKDGIQKGCRRFLVGIGGSATNDGGAGMLQALGFGLLDKEGKQIPFGARGLEKLEKITSDQVLPELEQCEFHIACDVENPLCGPQGCSAVYGPQKGADSQMIKEMDKWLADYAEIAKKTFQKADSGIPGTGAAGGLGFAFLTFTRGELKSGIQVVLEETRLEDYIKEADIVITGEGRLDGQTAMGKAPVGVAALGKKYGKPVIAFAGGVTKEARLCNQKGIDAYFPVLRQVCSLTEAMDPETARKNVEDSVEQVFRLIALFAERKM